MMTPCTQIQLGGRAFENHCRYYTFVCIIYIYALLLLPFPLLVVIIIIVK
jgi:hypothetical protein